MHPNATGDVRTTRAHDDDTGVVDWLRERDVACPGCGYNLRALTTPRCPECAQELILRIGLAEPRQAGFVAGLVGLAAGAGFSGLLTLYVLIVAALAGRSMNWWLPFFLTTAGGALVEGICTAVWIACGRRIRRLGGKRRGFLIAACWLLTLANLATFMYVIR